MAQAVDEAGNIWEVDAQGNAVRFIGKQGAPQSNTLITKQANPVEQRGDELKNQLTQVQIQKAIDELQKGDKPNLPTGYRMKADGSGAELIPGVAAPGANAKGDPGKAGAYNSVIQQIDRLYQLYNEGIGSTSGLASALDYLPSDANAAFDTAGAALGDQGNAAFKVPGMGAQSDADAARFVAANQPQSTDRDVAALEKLRALRQRLESNMAAVGLPAPQWNYDLQGKPLNVPQQLATGETRREVDPVASGIIDRMIRQGKSAEEINAVLSPLGFNPVGPGDVAAAQDYLRKNPKYDKSFGRAERILPIENPTLNAALQTAPGTAAATYLNAGGFGVPQALNPQAFEALRDKNPMSAFAGDVGGIITGTGLINKAGQQTVGRLLPAAVIDNPTTLQKFANFGRQLAPDATYGAIYGGVTEGDPLTGAATATAGSAGGQLLGKGLQKGFQGVSDPAVQYLTGRGIPLSIGETFGNNSIIGRQMQRMESLPLLGDMMSARRGEARDAVYRATLEDAVGPVGRNIDAANPLTSAQNIKNQAYTDAFSGVNVTPDDQFAADFAAANLSGRGVPKYGEDFGYMVDQEVVPLTSGPMGGPQIQSALQSTSKMRSGFMSNPDVMANYAANASGQMDEAISDLVTRQAPDVIPAYLRANQVNAMLTPIEKATISARGVPTPKQLQAAFTNNTVKYGGRAAAARGDKVPDVVRYAAENAPNIGNSGTADRLAGIMPFILPTTLGGSAAGLETFTDSPFLTGTLATLAALSTKTGQRATQAALTKRPKAIKRLGGIFGRREAQKGLAGMVTAPLLIED